MNKDFIKIIVLLVVIFVIAKACNRSDSPSSSALSNWEKTPVDELVKKLANEQNFTIVLYDMDAENDIYKHQYQVIVEKPDTVTSEITEWFTVSDVFFEQHLNDMGMEIASKKDGKLHKETAPAGYSNYVGNERYGHWVNRNGSSFWEFYGKYRFMTSMFHLMTYPARRAYWDDYYGGYYGRGRAYYGPSGNPIYGTRSYANTSTGKNSKWGNKSSDFKNKVRSKVSRSASATRAKRSSRTSRSSSRSSRNSSYRSRSGGFGK
ncbi:MAG: hypothetical protein CL843_19115 [Crocinitomicaceae bacterium]|nr:hypothetical protein [Crocinitomicaceae bacterium]|tara:strand:+ start:344 stop:1132 length:789 start_codon:yes stop_codon:yes gene_type:complete